ncbi:DUF3231 family protein [Sutcliffiella horikoshii]|uniref:DUF3231 family protein n=1 Tax=Sutcliffiella horikoshii TaxID=79883 RepID=A0A5D4T5G4_9BACI|nr:DUF3231 family protein [Sutcliffiella horikoshii]TYS70950.1 DUF3231 family protein [Sutcliffiella horikoshii]
MTNHTTEWSCAETSTLWTLYLNNSMSACVLRYFLETVEDQQIREIIAKAYDIASTNENELKAVFWKGKYPLPMAFSENDINLKAPRLFSDTFQLSYVLQMAKIGMVTYSASLSAVSKKDIRTLYNTFLQRTIEIFDLTTDLLLEKGLYIKKPITVIPDRAYLVEEKKYFSGLNPLINKRTLNTIEVTHLSMNIETNQIGMLLCTAFSQTAVSSEVREFMVKAKQLAHSHIKAFVDLLLKDDIQAPMAADYSVTASHIPPFSDKLMMFHTSLMVAAGIGNYATASSASQRTDLALKYEKLSSESALLAKSGADIMVKNRWMEKPPSTADREELSQERE